VFSNQWFGGCGIDLLQISTLSRLHIIAWLRPILIMRNYFQQLAIRYFTDETKTTLFEAEYHSGLLLAYPAITLG
jgi:hypothetical protein